MMMTPRFVALGIIWSRRSGWAGSALLIAAVLTLAGCAPVNLRAARPAQLPTPTPTPFVDLAAAPRPNFGAQFPEDPLLLAPVATQPPTPAPTAQFAAPTPTPEPLGDILTVGIATTVPDEWAGHLLALLNQTGKVENANGIATLQVLDQPELARTTVDLRPYAAASQPLVTRVLAAVAPFATVTDDTALEDLAARWRDPATTGPLVVGEEAAALLPALFGPRGEGVTVLPRDALLAQLESTPGAVGILRFDQVDPRFKVLSVNGVNPLNNRLDLRTYPLAVALTVEGSAAAAVRALLDGVIQPVTNRDPAQLTQLIMTGVTAMSRVTALRMDQKGLRLPGAGHLRRAGRGGHHPYQQRGALPG
jgi:hypothetical protein